MKTVPFGILRSLLATLLAGLLPRLRANATRQKHHYLRRHRPLAGPRPGAKLG